MIGSANVARNVLATDTPPSTGLRVEPSTIELRGAGDLHGLLVTAILADGRSVDVTRQARFFSRQPKVIEVLSNGVCRAVSNGSSEIIVRFQRRSAKVLMTVRDTDEAKAPSFRNEVLPVLTKAGCNAGACHGKLAGQNGFKLSLRAFAPEWDYDCLTSDVRGRRINYVRPSESLVILKPLAQVPHEGGQKLLEGSRAYQVLLDWIAHRTPGPATNEAELVRLELLPHRRVMRTNETQQLLVRAHYKDGRARDVTWLTQFYSNDENSAKVTPDGLVTALRNGETVIRAHFRGMVEVATMTIPFETKIAERQFREKSNAIDELVFAKLRSLRIPPSPVCDDATFLRRASLDVTGTLPTPEQVRSFLTDRTKEKRARLVNQLIGSPEFVEYWTMLLADLFQNRKERDHDVRGIKGVRSFQTWLREEVAANRPWNVLSREILTSAGSVVESPQVGYYVTLIGEKRADESEITDAVAQTFLGTRIGCARCHNHPLERFTQDDFYHFAAYFSRVSLKREDPTKAPTVLLPISREEEQQRRKITGLEKALRDAEALAANCEPGEEAALKKKISEQEKKLADARKQYDQAIAKMPGIMQPRTKKFMSPQPLDHSGYDFKPGMDLRVQLADWIVDPKNESFSGAFINRLWKHFFGVGLVEPVDDLRASNPPSNPELWQSLNHEFVKSGFDMRQMMRLIMNSRAYQLSSETSRDNQMDKKFYSHYYARRLPAEVMLDAISRSTGLPDEFKGYPVGTRALQLPEPGVASYFLTLFGRSDRVTACACERNGEVTLPQLLHLQNGDTVQKKIRAVDGRLLSLLKEEKDNRSVIEELSLATLNRLPSEKEVSAVERQLDRDENREEVFADFFWALLNTKEFAFNH